MKKLTSIFVIAILQLGMLPFLFAQEKNTGYEVFFINRQTNQEEYQLYKGATIAFYEPTTPSERLFNLDGVELGVPYTIKKIQSYYALGIPHVDFLITKDSDKDGKGIHIKCRNSESTDKKPGIYDLPAYLYYMVEAQKELYLNKKVFTRDKLYTVSDFGFENKVVSLVYTSDDGETFSEPLYEALDYTTDDSLVSVEKPENEAVQYGKTNVITEDGISKYSYIDNYVGIIIFHDKEQFVFSIHNLSDNTLKVIWDEAAYVDANGSTSKVIHSGVKYNERENSQTPSIIVKGAKITDIAVPVNNIEHNEILGWFSKPLYQPAQEGNIALLLPFQIKGVTNEYLFVFNRTFVLRHPELHDVVN